MRDTGREDAQRVLEGRALANVRALVDKVEAEDRLRTAKAVGDTLKLLPLFLVAAAIVIAVIVSVVRVARSLDLGAPKTAPEYIERALARIEKQADRNMRTEMTGRVRLNFILGPEGATRDVKVIESSLNGFLDAEAGRCVILASPFGPLPPGVSGPLSITRVFRFESTGGKTAALKIEREPGGAGNK